MLAEFGVESERHAELHNLPGGRGLTWRAGEIVLRPSAGDGETLWKANVLAELPHSAAFCTPRPIISASGSWSIDGWEAWQWLSGRADESRVHDVLRAGEAFHRALIDVERPSFLDLADDPWARADRIAWEEEEVPCNAAVQRLARAFRAVGDRSQVIHGDLLGNVMFDQGHPPVIIDWAPYWRPAGFADAIVLADAACWHRLEPAEMIRLADGRSEGRQHPIRALVFRIATFELLGVWDSRMQSRHEPVVAAALA